MLDGTAASTVSGRSPHASSPVAGAKRRPNVSMSDLRPWTRPHEAFWQFLCGATWRTCAPIALVVGTVLSLVNQGDVLVMEMGSVWVAVKIGFNYLIPYVTSSTGALLAVRYRSDPDARRGRAR
jgi:hypothetical protein